MKQGAFSLVELLIVISLIGILAGLSYPVYTRHIAHVNQHRATLILLEAANELEEQHSLFGTYKNTSVQALLAQSNQQLPYQFDLSVNDNRFMLKAIPNEAQESLNQCGILWLNSTETTSVTCQGAK